MFYPIFEGVLSYPEVFSPFSQRLRHSKLLVAVHLRVDPAIPPRVEPLQGVLSVVIARYRVVGDFSASGELRYRLGCGAGNDGHLYQT